MDQDAKDKLLDSLKQLLDKDGLNEDEALQILSVLRKSTDRNIAELTEQYLIESIEGNNSNDNT